LLAQEYAEKTNIYFTKSYDRENIVRDIKEECCKVALNSYAPSDLKPCVMNYELPSKQILIIDENVQTSATDLLFRGHNGDEGVQDLLAQLINQCPKDHKKELTSNIVLSGGTTNLPNFDTRLLQELKNLVPSTSCVISDMNPDDQNVKRQIKNWHGACVQSQLTAF